VEEYALGELRAARWPLSGGVGAARADVGVLACLDSGSLSVAAVVLLVPSSQVRNAGRDLPSPDFLL